MKKLDLIIDGSGLGKHRSNPARLHEHPWFYMREVHYAFQSNRRNTDFFFCWLFLRRNHSEAKCCFDLSNKIKQFSSNKRQPNVPLIISLDGLIPVPWC